MNLILLREIQRVHRQGSKCRERGLSKCTNIDFGSQRRLGSNPFVIHYEMRVQYPSGKVIVRRKYEAMCKRAWPSRKQKRCVILESRTDRYGFCHPRNKGLNVASFTCFLCDIEHIS